MVVELPRQAFLPITPPRTGELFACPHRKRVANLLRKSNANFVEQVTIMSESTRMGRRQLFRGAAVLTGGVVLAGAVDLSLSGLIDGAEAAARPRIHPPSDWGSRPVAAAPT